MHMGERYFRALWFNTGEKEGSTLIINEGSTILRGLAELFYRPKMPNRFEIDACGEPSAMPFFPTFVM